VLVSLRKYPRRPCARRSTTADCPFSVPVPQRSSFRSASTDDVVALEDRARPVSGQLHRHALRDAGAHQVSHGRSAEVMQDAVRAPGANSSTRSSLLSCSPSRSVSNDSNSASRLASRSRSRLVSSPKH